MIAKLPNDTGNGVMNSPPVAIRDPIFWRWHRHIDNIHTAWQNTQSPYDFTDAPPVVLRDALSGTPVPWASPDVLLVSTAGLHDTSARGGPRRWPQRRLPSGRGILRGEKPAETDPQTALDGASDPSDQNYCDCGWPCALLLPRGTPGGMAFRLAVFCTDGARDLVRPSAECGSMSFCGAVDRYPDTRDMGYPFSRPFGQPVAATILGLPAAAGRSLTIRHEP
jgi:hypothetical protein